MGSFEHYRDYVEWSNLRLDRKRMEHEAFLRRHAEAAKEIAIRLYVTHRRLTWNKRRLAVANALRAAHSKRSRRRSKAKP
jgi:hypothetical protein